MGNVPHIGIDAMGGDFGPPAVAEGTLLALREMPGHYKIKLRASGYRLVYRVEDERVVVVVVAIGKRERGAAYEKARER